MQQMSPSATSVPGEQGSLASQSPRVILLMDAGAWLVGLVLAVWGRYEFDLTMANLVGAVIVAPLAACVQTALRYVQYRYRGRCEFGSFDEIRTLSGTVLATSAILFAVNLTLLARPVPASAVV